MPAGTRFVSVECSAEALAVPRLTFFSKTDLSLEAGTSRKIRAKSSVFTRMNALRVRRLPSQIRDMALILVIV